VQSLRAYKRLQPGERIKVTGVVTLWWPSGRFFIQDETGPLEIQLLAPWVRDDPSGRYLDPLPAVSVAPGDLVEVVGYASTELSPTLIDAEYRRVGRGVEIKPVPLGARKSPTEIPNAKLVSVEANVLDAEISSADTNLEPQLVLQAGGSVFEALLPRATGAKLDIARGSVVRVTGINSVQTDRWGRRRNFQLLLRDTGDVTVLVAPPRWTLHTAARLGAIAGGVIVVGLVWIFVLRRRVSQRTTELAKSNTLLQTEVEERKRAEAGLARSLEAEKELNELKSRFVSMVSHEFRTPLGVILASADLLSDYLETLTMEERAEQIADIKQSTRHMAGLMEDVLVLGRVEAGKMDFHPIPLDVPDFCRRLVDEILSATSRACPVDFIEEDVAGPARGDETLLRHIFHNLLSNAVKYSTPGQPVQFRVERDNDDALFTVRDTGIGISPEDQKHIFDAFYRGKNVGQRPGSGLGLVVVKRCVELYGGDIQIQSVQGEGTTVTVRLPLFLKTGQTEIQHRRSRT